MQRSSNVPSFRDLGGMTCKWCSRVNYNLPSTYAAGLGSAVGCKVSVYKSSTVVNNMAPLSSNSRAVAAMTIIIGKITLGTFRAVLRDDASHLVVCAWWSVLGALVAGRHCACYATHALQVESLVTSTCPVFWCEPRLTPSTCCMADTLLVNSL